MDVLTIQWGWIGGKAVGAVPPVVISFTKGQISVSDSQLFSSNLGDGFLFSPSFNDEQVYSTIVSDN